MGDRGSIWSRRVGAGLAAIALGAAVTGCGSGGTAHDAVKAFGAYFAHHATDLALESATLIDDARERYGEDGKKIVCFVVQKSTVSNSGEVTLPTEADVKTGVEAEIFGQPPEQKAFDDIYEIAQDYTRGQLAKAAGDAGCGIQGLSEDL